MDIGWASCLVSIACIPSYMIYKIIFLEKGNLLQVRSNFLRCMMADKLNGPERDTVYLGLVSVL